MSRGPLDELLRRGATDADPSRIPRLPVHARVLDLPSPRGRVRVLAVWEDPGGGPEHLHRELRLRIEGSLLGELSSSAAALVEDDAQAAEQGEDPGTDHPAAVHLLSFGPLRGGPEAVAAFGLEPVDPGSGGLRGSVAALRHEATLLGLDFVPEDPIEAYVAEVTRPDAAVHALELRLRREGLDEVWGSAPGAPARRLVTALTADRGAGWPADPADVTPAVVDLIEAAVVPKAVGSLRWVPPLVFQGLCDAIGVAAARHLGAEVQWGLCAPEPVGGADDPEGAVAEDGFIPPPVLRFRARGAGDWRFVDLGREVLRWCVMPLAPGEAPPTLGAWVADVFR